MKLIKVKRMLFLALALFCFTISSVSAKKVKQTAQEYYSPKKEKEVIKALFYDDFTNDMEGEAPSSGYTLSSAGGEIKIEKIDTLSGRKNTLKVLDDVNSNSSMSLLKSFDPQNRIACEVRFKMDENFPVGPNASFVLSLMQGSTGVCDLRVSSNGGRFCFNDREKDNAVWASNTQQNRLTLRPGMWYTMSLYVDAIKKTADFRIESDQVKEYVGPDSSKIRYDVNKGVLVGKDFVLPTLKTDTVDTLRIFTSGTYSADYKIDYIKIVDNPEPFILVKAKPSPIPAPIVADPVQRAVPNKINVLADGRFIYYTEYPKEINGVLMAQYKSTLDALGFASVYNEDTQVISAKNGNETLELTVGKPQAVFNGETANITAPAVDKGSVWISIIEIANLLGYKADKNENIISIGRE